MPSVSIHYGPDQKLDNPDFLALSQTLLDIIVNNLGAQSDKVQIMPLALAYAPIGQPVYIEIKARSTELRSESVLQGFVEQVDQVSFKAFGCRCRIRYFSYPGDFLAAAN